LHDKVLIGVLDVESKDDQVEKEKESKKKRRKERV